MPVIVCHDPSGWSAPRRFADLLDPVATDVRELARVALRIPRRHSGRAIIAASVEEVFAE